MENRTETKDIGVLIEEHEPQLKSFVRKRVNNKSDVDDILQDVYYQLIKTIETALSPIEHLSAWLYKVAQDTITNRQKKKKEEELPFFIDTDGEENLMDEFSEVLFSDENTNAPEMKYLRSLFWIELENALSELPSEQREVFELAELEGLSVKEISVSTGVPINTLLSRKHYAVKHLRNRLSDLYEEIVMQ